MTGSLLDDEVAFQGAEGGARVLVLACGAIAREVLAVISLNGWTHVDVRCLPAKLHSRPERIPAAVDAKLTEQGRRDEVIVLVGGAPLNEEFGKAIGADAYCRDAAVAAETAQALVLARRAAAAAAS